MNNKTSPLFEVVTLSPVESIRDYRVQNQKNMYGGIHKSRIPMSHINPYTWACLQLIAEKHSKCGSIVPIGKVADAVILLENFGGSPDHDKIRSKFAEHSSRLVFNCDNTLVADAASAFTMADLLADYRENNIIPTSEKVEEAFAKNLSKCGVESSTKDGKVYVPSSASKVPTLGEALSHLIASDKPAFPSILMLASIRRRRQGLSGIYPVTYPKDIYRSAIGLGGETAPTKQADQLSWEDVAKKLSLAAGSAGVDLVSKYGAQKISRADMEAKLYLEKEYKNSTGKSSVSESDLDDWSSNNPDKAEKALYKGYQDQGISREEIEKILASAQKKDINWPLVVGASVGGVVVLGLLVFAIARK